MSCLRRLAILFGLLVFVGCGGDSGEEFVAQADRACRERVALAREADQGGPTSNALFADAYEEELDKLQEIEPPDDQADKYARLLELYGDRTERQREAADLEAKIERAKSRREYAELVERQSPVLTAANRARVQGNRLADELGLRVCGETLS